MQEQQPQRVLFVGATGVIGRRIVPALADRFSLVLAAREAGAVGGLPVAACDITDWEQTLALVQAANADAVVNCAIESPYRPDGSYFDLSDPNERLAYNESAIEVNVRGAYHLYEAVARAGVARFVFVSSMTVVLGKPPYPTIEPDAPPRPREFYACTKLFGEQLGQTYAAEYPMTVMCLRLGQPYPIDHPDEQEWLQDRRGRGLFVAVEDIAQAVAGALTSANAPGFVAVPVVSDSDSGWIDVSPATRAIGYAPRWRFSAGGMTLK
jgi:uronate dehydrogenase